MVTEYQMHALVEIFQPLDKEKLDVLRDSIQTFGGLRQPITVWQGKIIDGRHRYLACQELGLEPWVVVLPDDADPLDAVVDLNGVRRQMTSAQRAMAGARISADSRAGNPTGANQFGAGNSANLQNSYTQERAATALGVAVRSISTARQIIESGETEIIEKVDRAGKDGLKVSAAWMEIEKLRDARVKAKAERRRKAERDIRDGLSSVPRVFLDAAIASRLAEVDRDEGDDAPDVPEVTIKDVKGAVALMRDWRNSWEGVERGFDTDSTAGNAVALLADKSVRITSLHSAVKRLWRDALAENPLPLPPDIYDVVVVDPPWERDEMPPPPSRGDEFKPQGYPPMSLDELKAFGLPALLADDAWVFLWCRPDHLLDGTAKELAAAWGLKHWKRPLIWHKTGAIGGYKPIDRPRVNWEPVLVCYKGSPWVMDDTAFWELFAADATGDSQKPDAFYALVARCFGGERRLDVFNRREIKGFWAWGDKSDAR